MTLSAREQMLALAAGTVLLAGLTYLVGQHQIKAWQALRTQQAERAHEVLLMQRLVDQQPVWARRLEGLRHRLPSYPRDKDVTEALLRRLDEIATQDKLTLLSRDVEKESRQGDLYELSVACRWEGTLEPLTRFLFDLQQDDAILDVSQLTVAPTEKKVLRGTVVVYCSYTRTGGPVSSTAAAAANKGTTP